MIKIYKNIGRTIVETEDIKTIPSGVLELLEMGDLVIKKTGDELHSYYVSYRKYNEMSLTYVDHQNSEEVYFEKGENGWEWITTDITPLNGGGGSAEVPIFDATLGEDEDEKITVDMATEDRNDIYTNKYAIIGIRVVDEEEKTNVLYFKLRQNFVSEEILAYDLWDSDNDEHTISHLDLIFLWDGDDAKVQLDDEELQLGGGAEIMDITEQDIADQAKLAEIYNACPQVLRVSTIHDGLQMYRLQNDYRTENNKVYYSCLLFGTLVELEVIDSSGTYSINTTHYELTPVNNG